MRRVHPKSTAAEAPEEAAFANILLLFCAASVVYPFSFFLACFRLGVVCLIVLAAGWSECRTIFNYDVGALTECDNQRHASGVGVRFDHRVQDRAPWGFGGL